MQCCQQLINSTELFDSYEWPLCPTWTVPGDGVMCNAGSSCAPWTRPRSSQPTAGWSQVNPRTTSVVNTCWLTWLESRDARYLLTVVDAWVCVRCPAVRTSACNAYRDFAFAIMSVSEVFSSHVFVVSFIGWLVGWLVRGFVTFVCLWCLQKCKSDFREIL